MTRSINVLSQKKQTEKVISRVFIYVDWLYLILWRAPLDSWVVIMADKFRECPAGAWIGNISPDFAPDTHTSVAQVKSI